MTLLGLTGCGVVFQNFNAGEYKGLSSGMPKDEVLRAFGAPQKQSALTIEGKEYEAWEYPASDPETRKFNRLGTVYYKIFFQEGKVVRWDKNKVYAQPSYEFRESLAPEQKVTIIKTPAAEKTPEMEQPLAPEENLK